MEFRVVFGSYNFSQYSERKKKSVTFVRVVHEGSQPSVMSIWNVSAISSTTVEGKYGREVTWKPQTRNGLSDILFFI